MKELFNILQSNWASSFGETILHSLWQGVIILAVYLIVSKLSKTSSQKVNVGLFALVTQLVVSSVTFYIIYSESFNVDAEFGAVNNVILETNSFSNTLQQYSPYLFVGWLLGFTFLCLRFVFSLAYVEWIKRAGRSTLGMKAEVAFKNLKDSVAIDFNNISIFESNKVATAMAIGHLKPVILLPIALVSQLSIEQVEVVIAHELAHIKRRDFLINLIQTIVESIYFFHPVYWFIGKEIREKREHSCDDLAAEWTGKGVLLAKTLAQIQLAQDSPAFAMAFGKKKMTTLSRIQRLLGYKNDNQGGRFIAIILMFAMLITFGFTSPERENDQVLLTEKLEEVMPLETTMLVTQALADTSIQSTTESMNENKMTIKSDKYEVLINKDGILMNGAKFVMNPTIQAEFEKSWAGLMQSQQEIEVLSEEISKEGNRIAAIHEEVYGDMEMDPSNDPNFQKYLEELSSNGEKLGEVAQEMQLKIQALDRNDKDYNAKAQKITKSYQEKMKVFESKMKAAEPEIQAWQKNIETKQKEIERRIQKPTAEAQEKMRMQELEIQKVAKKLEAQHEKIIDLLPQEVREDIKDSRSSYSNSPAPPMPPNPPLPPMGSTSPPAPLSPPAPPSPPAPIKD